MPPLGDKINDFGSRTSGTVAFGPNENSKLFSKVTRPIRACIMPNRSPIQLRGPSPNGNHVAESRLFFSSLENRSGSNCSGFG